MPNNQEVFLNNIFVYGSLMYSEVWDKIVSESYLNCAATIKGYERFAIQNEVYPAVIKSKGSEVEGLIWKDVNDEDLARLNEFEGEYYVLQSEKAIDDQGSLIPVCFYLLKSQYHSILKNENWDIQRFESKNLPLFISSYAGFDDVSY